MFEMVQKYTKRILESTCRHCSLETIDHKVAKGDEEEEIESLNYRLWRTV